MVSPLRRYAMIYAATALPLLFTPIRRHAIDTLPLPPSAIAIRHIAAAITPGLRQRYLRDAASFFAIIDSFADIAITLYRYYFDS